MNKYILWSKHFDEGFLWSGNLVGFLTGVILIICYTFCICLFILNIRHWIRVKIQKRNKAKLEKAFQSRFRVGIKNE